MNSAYTNKFDVTCAEVLEFLKYISDEKKKKLPQKLLKELESNKNPNLQVKINPDKSVVEQEISNDAKILIAMLYKDFWANNEEKINFENQILKDEEDYNKRYSSENIFKSKNIEKNVSTVNTRVSAEKSLVKTNNSFLGKIFSWLKKLIRK